jgi:hypothetical protein
MHWSSTSSDDRIDDRLRLRQSQMPSSHKQNAVNLRSSIISSRFNTCLSCLPFPTVFFSAPFVCVVCCVSMSHVFLYSPD